MRRASAVWPAESDGSSVPSDCSLEETDEVLMKRFCDGNHAAFEELFERYRDRIFTYLTRLVGRTVAEDLTQSTFLSVIRARSRFATNARFRPWIYAIATNAARDAIRRAGLEALTPQGRFPVEVAGEEPLLQDAGLKGAVSGALQQLPETQRLAIVMHRFQGLSFNEIGEALHLTERVVRARAHRGYDKLRQLLRSLWESA